MSMLHPYFELAGCDYSHHQDPIDTKVFFPYNDFVLIRIGDGIDAPNPDHKFTQYWSEARIARKTRGAWYYFRPDKDAIAQADVTINAIKNDWPEMGVYIDLEEKTTCANMSRTQVTAQVLKYLAAVDEETRGKRGRQYTGIYSRPDWLLKFLNTTVVPHMYERAKWLANWPYGDIVLKPTTVPAGWLPEIWQCRCTGWSPYGTRGNGKELGVYSWGLDINVWMKRKMDFQTYFGCQVNSVPVTRPKTLKAYTGCNVRQGPSATAPIIFTLPQSVVIPIEAVTQDTNGKDWYKLGGNEASEMWIAGWLGRASYQ